MTPGFCAEGRKQNAESKEQNDGLATKGMFE